MHNGFSQGSLEHSLKYCRFAAREDVTPFAETAQTIIRDS